MRKYEGFYTDGPPPPRDRMRSAELNDLVQQALALQIDSDTDAAAAKELIESAMNALAETCSAIQGQIDAANQRRWDNNEFSDPDWYRRVHGALRAKRWQRQQLQNKIGLVNRAVRQQGAATNERTRERLFIHIAAAHLPRETFAHFWSLVDEEMRTKEDRETKQISGPRA